MAQAYRDDLRRKLIEGHAAGKASVEELADRFGVGARWAWKLMSLYKRTGTAVRTPQSRCGVVPMPVEEPVRRLLQAQPDLALRGIQAELRKLGHSISVPQLRRVVKRLGLRVHGRVPEGHWKMPTIVGAMDHIGMLATMTVEAATGREIFLAYLDQVLCPKLRPGHVVVMDNLSTNKVAGVRERLEARAASLLYLPPQSPDLNPIEEACAKLKQGLRTAPARTVGALDQAIADLLPLSPQTTSQHGSRSH